MVKAIVYIYISIAVAIIILFSAAMSSSKHKFEKSVSSTGTCNLTTCGALDNVSDPAYNVKQVIKQSILLEEHLAEDNKFCKDCIIKHFLHIIGLCEEAVWLATDHVEQFPQLEESVTFYNHVFDMWLSDRNSLKIRRQCLSLLRDHRKKLVELYYAE